MQPVTTEAFETLVAEALDGLPPELGALMQNVAVLVADWGESPDLLGLYDGIPLTDRDDYGGGGMALPDRITVYRLAL
ncbi:MAG TPA: metallopeptidase family protein, partial [Acidimicrobiia bacterium]|nr:metallopeptidase family protein [Acidimicrobiia bacterium]